jgi:aldose 1-epimerase
MQRDFGSTAQGTAAQLLRLESDRGLTATVTDFGATLVALHVPDRQGAVADVVLGFDDVRGYASPQNPFFGATIGRVANRIARATFVLGDRRHRLAANEGLHHLHGGRHRPFHLVRWDVAAVAPDAVTLTYRSPAGEEGYPGCVEATACYHLDGDALRVEYEATTDAVTPLNMTNHTYWNLRGAGDGTVLDHEVSVSAAACTPTDADLIPTGAVAAVEGTALDLRGTRPLRAGVAALADTPARGYDHNLVLDHPGQGLRPVARLRDPRSGRTMELSSDQPCLQLYSGNRLEPPVLGKAGRSYLRYGGVCLEPQGYPDAVHRTAFPPIWLEPGRTYRHVARYRFSAT